MIITIDGPTASGKSTVARIIAVRLGYYYICSGLLFRGLGYVLLHKKGYALDTIASPDFQDVISVLDEKKFVYRYDSQYQERLFYENMDITRFLKDSLIDSASSIVSTNIKVRELLCDFQRKLAEKHNIVVDGRDVGSVVFPQADYKFFLTADPEVRALRWQLQQQETGLKVSLSEALKIIAERDKRDSERTIAPLVIPKGALVINNSTMDPYQTADALLKVIQI